MSEEDIFKKDIELPKKADQLNEDSYKPILHKKKSGFFKRVFRFIAYLFGSLIAIVGLGGAAAAAVLYFLSADLPDHNSLRKYSPLLSSRVFLKDGSKLCEYSYEKRYFIPIELIPDKLINAFIAVEDKNFYHHKGIDFYGIARSIVNNIKKIGSGKRPQGASTITQQIARIFLIKTNKVS